MPRLPWQTAVMRQRPATATLSFQQPALRSYAFLSSKHSKKCSKCVFAYTIIIIQSRAAFNPCCLFYTKKIVFFAQKAELFVNKCRFSPQKTAAQSLCSGLVPAGHFEWFPRALRLFRAGTLSTPPRVKMPLERSVFLTGSRSSAPEPAVACARDKRRSRHTGKACCGSPAARGTARWAPVPAAPAPAGKVQSPCRRAGWDT